MSIAAHRKRKPRGSYNAPTPQRLAKADQPLVPGLRARDALEQWRREGIIHDEHFRAGRWFQQLCESAITGHATTPGNACADRRRGYRPAMPMPTAVAAGVELQAIRTCLGDGDFALLSRMMVGAGVMASDRLAELLCMVERRVWRSGGQRTI